MTMIQYDDHDKIHADDDAHGLADLLIAASIRRGPSSDRGDWTFG